MKILHLLLLICLAGFGCNISDDERGIQPSPDSGNVNNVNNSNNTNNVNNGADSGTQDVGVEADMGEPQPDMSEEVDMNTGPEFVLTDVESVRVTEMHPGGGEDACVRAQCPAGKTVVGGGGRWSPDISVGSIRAQFPRNRVICGRSETQAQWTVEALCARTNPSYPITSETVEREVPEGGRQCVVAECPTGSFALSGGSNFSLDFAVDSMKRQTNDSWAICGTPTANTTVRADVICIEGVVPTLGQENATHPGFDGICIDAGCGQGQLAIGGGGEWSSDIQLLGILSTDFNQNITLCGDSSNRAAWSVETTCVPAN